MDSTEKANLQAYIDDPTAVDAAYKALVESSIWNVIRLERDQKLKDSDWTVMDGSPLSDSKKNEWKTYRQALRDMPQGTVPVIDIDQNIVSGLTWPTEPS